MKIVSLGVKQDNNHSLTPNKEATEPRVTQGYQWLRWSEHIEKCYRPHQIA